MNADGRFTRCLGQVLHFEGDWSDDPADPGGATMHGVTLATYSAFLGRQATKAELRLIPASDVAACYRRDFWAKVRGDDLPAGLDLLMFDTAVNCGPGTAAHWLQHALGVAQDGVLGVGSLRALADSSTRMVIEDVRQEREAHYRALSTFARFGSGWLNRLEQVAATAQAWAA